jgi:hypothetical protein
MQELSLLTQLIDYLRSRSQKFGGDGGNFEAVDLEGQLVSAQGRSEWGYLGQILFISKQIVE